MKRKLIFTIYGRERKDISHCVKIKHFEEEPCRAQISEWSLATWPLISVEMIVYWRHLLSVVQDIGPFFFYRMTI